MTMMLRRALMEPAGGDQYPVGTDILNGATWREKSLYNSTTGEIASNSTYASTLNFSAVNTSYTYEVSIRTFVYYYQSNGDYIERQVVNANGSLTIPQNAAQIHVSVNTDNYQNATIIRTA